MIKCEHCKKKYNEVKVLIDGTKMCYKCYSMELDNENYKLRQFILLTLPTPYLSNLFKETYGNRKITYNQYEVIDIKTVDMIVLVKTVNKYTGEIFWFVGFATKTNLIDDVKRILNLEHKYPNRFFREMFREDRKIPLILDEACLIQKRKKENII